MANEENQNQQNQNFTPPPPEEINIRGMESDRKSIERGDAAPVPQTVLPPQDEKEPMFRPETRVSDSFGSEELPGEERPHTKKGLIITVVVVLVVAAAVTAYFVFFQGETQPPVQPPPPPPPVLPPPPAPHVSLFISRPANFKSSEILLNNLLTTTINDQLSALALDKLPDGGIKEVAVLDDKRGQIPFGSFISAYLTSFTPEQIKGWLEDDFTAFLYYNKDGVWPGYIARIKNGVNIEDIKTNLKSMENSATVSKFYLAPVGSFGEFKDGKLNQTPTRYSVGSSKGASFNYLFTNNFLIISTSFDGLKTVTPLLLIGN